MSVLGLNLGYTVKYNPLPLGVCLGFALGNSFRQRVIFDRISLVLSLYGYSIFFCKIPFVYFVPYQDIKVERSILILFKGFLMNHFLDHLTIHHKNTLPKLVFRDTQTLVHVMGKNTMAMVTGGMLTLPILP